MNATTTPAALKPFRAEVGWVTSDQGSRVTTIHLWARASHREASEKAFRDAAALLAELAREGLGLTGTPAVMGATIYLAGATDAAAREFCHGLGLL